MSSMLLKMFIILQVKLSHSVVGKPQMHATVHQDHEKGVYLQKGQQ